MTHISNTLPIRLGVTFSKFLTKFIGCFANYHCVINYSAKQQPVCHKIFIFHTFYTSKNQVYGRYNMFQSILNL